MTDRMALVIGSESEDFGRLGFTSELAEALYTTLTTEGHWLPVGDGPVLNPTIAELKRHVKTAFRTADDLRATLLIAFLGHGYTSGEDDFFLLASDSTQPLDSDAGLHLVNVIAEQLGLTKTLDGLIVLVDACEAGTGALGAGSRWVRILEKAAGRMELLVASDRGNAYDGCFTRTILRTFDSGLGTSGTNLLCGDLTPEINAACQWQTPRHLSFNGAQVLRGDLGLWLVPNMARHRDAVTGRPAAGLVDHLLHTVSPTTAVQEIVAAMVESAGDRLQALVGPAGSGKSTIMALLIRPALIPALGGLTAEFVTAAVFLDLASSVESVVAELAAQLDNRFGIEFRSARETVLAELTDHERFDEFEITVVRPLNLLRAPGRRIRLLIDGLDQPEDGRDGIIAAVATLTSDERLTHVRVIVGIRSGTGVDTRSELTHARVFPVRLPTLPELLGEIASDSRGLPGDLVPALAGLADDVTSGGWLIPRLITEIDWTLDPDQRMDLHSLVERRFRTTAERPAHAAVSWPLVALLVAVGVGPVAPLRLLAEALHALDKPVPLPHLHDVVVDLGVLVARGHPGQEDELVGLAHLAFIQPLTAAVGGSAVVRAAHSALADILLPVAGPEPAHAPDISTYAIAAAPRHLLASGNPTRALEFLDQLDTRRRPIDNRESWAGWLTMFEEALSPDDAHLLEARSRLARWTGDAGDPHAARDMFTELATYCARVLGPERQETIAARLQLADWIGQLGDPEQAVAIMTELLPLQLALTEPEHPNTLRIRADLGFWIGQAGDIVGARDQYTEFLPLLDRVLEPTHVDAMRARDQYARWVGEAGDPAAALRISAELVPVYVRVLGPEHSDTLWAQLNLAWWMGSCGDLSDAVELNAAVASDRERVSGSEHPATLVTKANLAHWLGMSGEYAKARDLCAQLLPIRLRLYSADNFETCLLQQELAEFTGRAGDPAGARDCYAELLGYLELSPGADHSRNTAEVRTALAFWTNAANGI